MSDTKEQGENSVNLEEPFHGKVWLAVSAGSASAVNLAVSIERSWDAEIRIHRVDAVALASALGGASLHTVNGETVDGAEVVIVARGERIGIVIVEERIGDVLILGSAAGAMAEHLRAAAREDP